MNPVFTIFRGDSKTMYLRAVNADCNGIGDPLDLTSATEIAVYLPNADGTQSVRLKSLGQVVVTSPAVLGKFSVLIDNTISPLLNVGEFQNVDVTFTISGQVFTVAFQQALSVFDTP